MRTFQYGAAVIGLSAMLAAATPARGAEAEAVDARTAQLQRHYAMRMRLEQERRNRDNESRVLGGAALSSLVGGDNPSVTQMRAQTTTVVNALGDQWICNDIDVNNESGNTTIVCGSQTGNIDSTRTEVGGDLINYVGGRP